MSMAVWLAVGITGSTTVTPLAPLVTLVPAVM